MREAQEKIRASATKKIEEILTKDQKATLDKMFGKPFDFSTIRRGPGPGGPPPGGPDDRGRPAERSKPRSDSVQ
jgi:hypothetical protein